MAQLRLPVLAVCAALVLRAGDAYNLDTSHARIFSDPSGGPSSPGSSYFGYSVALYVGRDAAMLLVGAPRANSSRPADLRDRVFEPGAVYRCYLDGRCVEWIIDNVRDNRIFGQYTPTRQKKDSAWLGATVVVENSPMPRVAVCAPMWKKNFRTSTGEHWYMNGMCYSVLARDSSVLSDGYSSSRYFPFIDQEDQLVAVGKDYLYYYGMGQAGFSAHVAPGSHRLALGAPGVFHWTGSALLLEDADEADAARNLFDALVPKVKDDPRFEYNDYFGYSITSGQFFGAGERLYAAGAPRSAEALGRAFVFAFPRARGAELLVRYVAEGEQYGEYFGASLAACDVNGDGRDDLVVGAPLWSRLTDEGRVYGFVSEGQSRFRRQSVDGEQPSGRLGSAVACPGDLDQDGFADVVAGAPYEAGERGAVYVFSGGARGLAARPSQRIRAAELSPTLRGFGLALSEPARDVDGNGYADLAVGAYLSGQAVLLTGKPVVGVNVELGRFDGAPLAQNSTHFGVNVCADYEGHFAPDAFKVTLMLKIDEIHRRALVYENGKLFAKVYKIFDTLRKGQRKCTPVKINLKKNVQNMVDPIKIVASLRNGEDPSCSGCPVIRPSSKTVDNLKLAYALDCGSDNACTSDLQLRITSSLDSGSNSSSYTIGSRSNVNVSVFVRNAGEAAYRAQAHIYVPEPISLVRLPLECEEQSQVNRTLEITCSLGNPLRLNTSVSIELDMNSVQYPYQHKEILVAVATQSQEANPLDNTGSLRIDYKVDADLGIEGKSEEDYYSYSSSDANETSPKVFTFHHIYEVQKIGSTPIQKAAIFVEVPVLYRGTVIARLNHVRGSVNNQKYSCKSEEGGPSPLVAAEPNSTFSREIMFSVNCTDADVTCQKLRCDVGPFVEASSVAKLIVTIDFYVLNLTVGSATGKDVDYVSQAYVRVIEPNVTIGDQEQKFNFKRISTSFFNRHNPETISLWVIFLSVLLGLVLLIIISSLLFKFGFFERNRREDLQTSKLTDGENQDNHSESMEELDCIAPRT